MPGIDGLASPGDVLLWVSMCVGIVALAHAGDGKGGTGRLRSREWYHTRFKAAADGGDWHGARRAVTLGLRTWPDDSHVRWFALSVVMGTGNYEAAATGALGVLADPKLSEQNRGRFLDGYSDALLMTGDPATLDAAEKALGEADVLLPDDVRLATTRALLSLRRGDLDAAAAGARQVLTRDAPGEHPRARMVLLDTLLAQYWSDCRAAPGLLELLEGLGDDSSAEYLCSRAAYLSHAGDHFVAAELLRNAAGRTTDPNESAWIGYHLAYVLARAGDSASVPEIDRLLSALPADYPAAPARAHTTALRHLAAGDGDSALVEAARALDSDTPSPVEAAEVHLTMSAALLALSRPSEAALSRAEAARLAPDHQLLDPVTT